MNLEWVVEIDFHPNQLISFILFLLTYGEISKVIFNNKKGVKIEYGMSWIGTTTI